MKCDLQVHSRFSDQPSEWLLRKLGIPESYTQPKEVHAKAKAADMDLVTITDHDTLNGVLEIADKPDVFLSVETTAQFHDGVKVHILIWGLSEAQFQDIQELRRDIYELRHYLKAQSLAHGVAHPFFSVDGKLTPDHIEKLILLFDIFEGINGTRNPLANRTAQFCLESLTPEKMLLLAEKHGVSPENMASANKVLTGGSDDHGGLFIARAFTEANGADLPKTPENFLRLLRDGRVQARGEGGSPQTVASGIYNTAHHFMRDYLKVKTPLSADLMSKMFERFLAGQNPVEFSFGEKVGLVAEAVRSGQIFSILNPGASIPRDLADFFGQPKLKKEIDHILKSESTAERRSFLLASEITNYLGYRFFKQMVDQVGHGDFLGSLQSASALVPVASIVLPYIISFQSLYSSRKFLESVSKQLTGSLPPFLQNNKRAWLTDTLEDVNGVARTIRTMTRHARLQGHDLTVITSRSTLSVQENSEIPIQNFRPVGEFELPEYELQKLSFPPVLEMLDYIAREGFSELVISTPGPVGIVGLIASKIFGLRVSGIYHTDFPQYVKILCNDDVMETLTWNYMHWFYAQLDTVYSNSRYYRDIWIRRGVLPEKLQILPRGLDTDLFHVRHRDTQFWKKKGAKEPVLLYVGRISKEKDLDMLPDVAAELQRRKVNATWAFVGDGPFRTELQKLMPHALFTGILAGLELGRAYASADIFVFPSTTDTYGNVVVEACAAGLPVVVADVGGPRELVKQGIPGVICERRSPSSFADAIESLVKKPMKVVPPNLSLLSGWDEAAKAFWHRD